MKPAAQAAARRNASSPRPDTSRCTFITGDALTELRKLRAKSVNVILTSPPYWVAKGAQGSKGIGFEKTLTDYVGNLVTIFHEARRVLRDDGILWVSIDDAYEDGNLLFIPTRLALALQDDGWSCRAEIVWSKTTTRTELVTNRPSKDYEKVLMFVKQRQYLYDADPIRVPPVGEYRIAGHKKRVQLRHDTDTVDRFYCNPMGRNSGSVWQISTSNYRGKHPATFPPELVNRLLLVSCPEGGTVLDIFGGAGTTALVALKLGHKAISIEVNPAYTKEARQRIIEELGDGDSAPGSLAAD